MKKSFYKTRIDPRIKKLADKFGVEYRVAKDPASAKIMGVHPSFNDQKIIGCYFGEGVVWLRDKTNKPKEYMDIVCLHELGHAILQFFQLTHSRQIEEVMANAISLAFAAHLKLPVPIEVLETYDIYSNEVGKDIWKQQCKNLLSSSVSWVQSVLQTPRRKS